ncbi:MAG: ATP-binding protein [Bacteroidota bacterium]|nr:ATP-binding protein [Bacteroidota bacterium]MDP4211755.1 ATP-binding protein [Bacteroidota bacterium]
MLFKDIPIRRKMMRGIILICCVVLMVTCISFFCYEVFVFRKSTMEKLSTIGRIISANSTAALAFDNREDAKEILLALRTEPHIVMAALYDQKGNLFSRYPVDLDIHDFPVKPGQTGYHLRQGFMEGFQPVAQDDRQLGSFYVKSDLGGMYERFRIFGLVAALVITLSFLLAVFLSKILQRSISNPILALAETAKIISDHRDYSVRAVKLGRDELGSLTDAFNDMLAQIEQQNRTLNEFNQNLEQKVKERTIQLESVNKELEAFSYSISHDLRAPLRGIIGFTAILEEDYSSKLDEEARRITTVIKNNTMRMGHLIDDLLTFSRMGRQDIVKTKIPTDMIIEEVIKELVPATKMGKISWIIHHVSDVKGDINAIRQVWINLISNAVKYSGNREHPRIEIGSFNENRQIVFFVKDNGVGFDEKYKDKLFKVFQRLHSADDFEGTGVGLAIVEKIISKHGGKVWAEGEVNKMAAFYFSLPADY